MATTSSAPPKNRHSERIVGLEVGRVLDEGTKKRRLQKQLDALERDNVQDDPHANLSWHKSVPKFEDELVGTRRPGKKENHSSSQQEPHAVHEKRT